MEKRNLEVDDISCNFNNCISKYYDITQYLLKRNIILLLLLLLLKLVASIFNNMFLKIFKF